MARYSVLLGRRVEVHYRAGDILLPASGLLVADSGRSIFLEQSLVQRGQTRHFRWEIPYQYIVRLEEKLEAELETSAGTATAGSRQPGAASARGPSTAASTNSAGTASMLPLPNRPKTA
jgi:hypothetical protein